MPEQLTFLHISDLHFGHGAMRTRFDQEIVVQSMLRSAEAMAQTLGAPDWVLVTGDVAYSARPEEYQRATAWLEDLIQRLGIRHDQVLVVPGNHDVDRKQARSSLVARTVHEKLRQDSRVLDELVGAPDEMRTTLWPKLASFAAFASQSGAPALTPEEPFWQRSVDSPLGPVVFAGLNTALASFDDEDSPVNLLLGKGQLSRAIVATDPGVLLVVLQHHPPSWLADGHDLERHLRKWPHLIFCGHVHDQDAVVQCSLAGGHNLTFIAGAGHGSRASEHGYAWVRLTREGVAYHPLTWSDKHKDFRPARTEFEAMDKHGRVFVPAARYPALNEWLGNARPAPGANAPSPPPDFDPERPHVYLPLARKGDRIIGRAERLAHMRERLERGSTTFGHGVALIGLGGVGKTQMAAEYAHEYADEYTGGVYWFHADQEMDGQMMRLSDSARWAHPATEPAIKRDMARHRLRTVENALFIFDDVESVSAIEALLPEATRRCHVIATSREELAGFPSMTVSTLAEEDAVALLETRSGRPLADDDDRDAARRIATMLDGLPLALEILAVYLGQRPATSWTGMAERLAERGLDAASVAGRDFERHSATHHRASLRATLALDEALLGDRPVLARALTILAWSAPTSMSGELLSALVARDGDDAAEREDALWDGMSLAVSLGVVYQEDGASEGQPMRAYRYRMHRLVRLVYQETHERERAFVEATVTRLGDWLQERLDDTDAFIESLASAGAEQAHVEAWRTWSVDAQLNEPAARLGWLEARFLSWRGADAQARERLEAARQILPASSQELRARVLDELGRVARSQGEYQEALAFAENALDIRTAIQPPVHHDVAESLSSMSSVTHALGQYDKALEFARRALRSLEEAGDSEHPDTMAEAHNLVSLCLSALGRKQEALAHVRRALAICERFLGRDHPNTGVLYGNLGGLLGELGELQQALEFAHRALDVVVSAFGPVHPHCASARHTLGALYYDRGNYRKALAHAIGSMEIFETTLGQDSPITANAYNLVDVCHHQLGQYDEALEYAKRVLAIRERSLGAGHPHTAYAYRNIVARYVALDRMDKAREYDKRAFVASQRLVAFDLRRVSRVELHNFRGVADMRIELPLDQRVTVLVGRNGAGKTTLLEALAQLLHLVHPPAVSHESPDELFPDRDLRNGHNRGYVRARLRLLDAHMDLNIDKQRSEASDSDYTPEPRDTWRVISTPAPVDRASRSFAVYYPVDRAVMRTVELADGSAPLDPDAVYHDALRAQGQDFTSFFHWFRTREDLENETRLSQDPAHRDPQLESVRQAIYRFLPGYQNLRVRRNPLRMCIDKPGQETVTLDQLSQGEKCLLAMVGDLARRLAMANPDARRPWEGTAIVLIDEIELHLHPAWQEKVIPGLLGAFPGSQFIVTTHSPQILTYVDRQAVKILDECTLVERTPHTKGRDVNALLIDIMGVSPRPADVEHTLREIAVLMDKDQLDAAREKLDELARQLGEEDAEIVRNRTMLDFLEA